MKFVDCSPMNVKVMEYVKQEVRRLCALIECRLQNDLILHRRIERIHETPYLTVDNVFPFPVNVCVSSIRSNKGID